MKRNLKIIELRNEGHTYNEICKILNCARSTVTYHLSEKSRASTFERVKKNRNSNPLTIKHNRFINRKIKIDNSVKLVNKKINERLNIKIRKFNKSGGKRMFSVQDLVDKIGPNPKCYLTGRDIDLSKPRTYHLDHIIPTSKGGDNSLENCGLACKEANQAKSDMTLSEFKSLCNEVLSNLD